MTIKDTDYWTCFIKAGWALHVTIYIEEKKLKLCIPVAKQAVHWGPFNFVPNWKIFTKLFPLVSVIEGIETEVWVEYLILIRFRVYQKWNDSGIANHWSWHVKRQTRKILHRLHRVRPALFLCCSNSILFGPGCRDLYIRFKSMYL